MQLVAFGVQTPTMLVVVVQLLLGGMDEGAGAAPPCEGGVALPVVPDPVDAVPVMPGDTVPVDAVAMPVPPLPEQLVVVGKTHEKPSPQSLSTLQSSCHLYMQVETLVVVQTGGVSGAKHWVFGGQVAPPEQDMTASVWHTIVGPQSASVAHDASMQEPVVTA
jgi:hypothetical protein